MFSGELEIYLESRKFPLCTAPNCKNSVEFGGYIGGISGALYREKHKNSHTYGEFITLLFEEDENFVV